MDEKITLDLDRSTAAVLLDYLGKSTINDIKKHGAVKNFKFKVDTIDMANTILYLELKSSLKNRR